MTVESEGGFDDEYIINLKISRNKVLIHLSNYLDAVAECIVSESESTLVPCYCRDPKKFGKRKHV